MRVISSVAVRHSIVNSNFSSIISGFVSDAGLTTNVKKKAKFPERKTNSLIGRWEITEELAYDIERHWEDMYIHYCL